MKHLFFIFLVSLLLLPCGSSAAKVDQSYRKIARNYGFVLEAKPRLGNGIGGQRISVEETEKELERFFKALQELPQNFVN